jgi:phosphoribosyl 1,2-cyclic phosphodiesterase
MSKYGGNTSCFEIETEKSKIFIDAGTGFSSANFNSDDKQVYVLFTHLHHDHIQGLLFNPHLFQSGSKILATSALLSANRLRRCLTNYFSPPFFPPDVFNSLKDLKFINFEQVITILREEVEVASINLRHPGGAVGYSFSKDTRKVIILLDNEFEKAQEADLIDFCGKADVLIWDGMFTEDEIMTKKGWGHSTIEQAEWFSGRSNVRKTVICHHAPGRTDIEIDKIEARQSFKNVEFGVEKTRYILS